jgi:tetratricopeptide (TPR) repeat protein
MTHHQKISIAVVAGLAVLGLSVRAQSIFLETASEELAEQPASNPLLVQVSADDFFEQGQTKLERNDYEGAIADFTQAITLDPTFAAAYMLRGGAYMATGSDPFPDLDRAIDLDPILPEAYATRAAAYLQEADYQAALNDSYKAIELDAKLAAAYISRGSAYHGLGNQPAAIADFQQGAELAQAQGRMDLYGAAIALKKLLELQQ